VDEALKEIPFGGLGRTPRELELLVRREPIAAPEQIEPSPVRPLDAHPSILYARRVATILLCGVDLYFRGKLEGMLPGHRLVTTDSAHTPDMVIADIARIEPVEVADAFPDVPILGYTNHTDTAGLRAAHAAGFDQVIVKSALVERCTELVDELVAT
jgi:DNA-binding NarL/FixJ family response regulator